MLKIEDTQMQALAAASPGKQMIAPCPKQATWIGIQLVDKDGKPVAGEKYRVVLPDSSVMEGATDKDGKASFQNIIAGQAKVSFPGIDGGEWKPK